MYKRKATTWKHGPRTIAGRTFRFRSKWEANYARWLQYHTRYGAVVSWEYEPKTFWFEGIKRGCVSYLPDFHVVEVSCDYYVEVKGYMDPKSKTKVKRMAKYYPDITLQVIDATAYAKIDKFGKTQIMGWE